MVIFLSPRFKRYCLRFFSQLKTTNFKTTPYLEVTFQPRVKLMTQYNLMLFSCSFDFFLSLSSIQTSILMLLLCLSLSLSVSQYIFFSKTHTSSLQLLFNFPLRKIHLNSMII